MMEAINVQNKRGNSVVVYPYGATVVSWKVGGKERLFLSKSAKLDGSKAIRGGIPVVFPNFGPWECGPQHGFARISNWGVVEKKSGDDVAQVVFRLNDNDESRKMWNYKFSLTYKVTLEDKQLQTSLSITNVDDKTFDFTTLLHTYIRLSDVNKCKVFGFNGCLYDDKVTSESDVTETDESATISKNIDRVYRNTSSHEVQCEDTRIKITKENLPDTVMWNPWIDKAAAMGDFDNDGYMNMVCVEPGYVAARKELKPGETFACSQTLHVLD